MRMIPALVSLAIALFVVACDDRPPPCSPEGSGGLGVFVPPAPPGAAAHGFGFAPGGGFGVTRERHDDRDANTPW